MFMLILFVLLLTPFQAESTLSSKRVVTPPTPLPSCPVVLRPRPKPRIVGGDITPKFAPLIASFSKRKGRRVRCGGVLLDKKWILSAAHCRLRPSWTVRLGGETYDDGKIAKIARVINHPRYDPVTFDFDIALVELAKGAPSTSEFALVNGFSQLPIPGAFAKAVGYGTLESGEKNRDPRLNSVDVPVVGQRKCVKVYGDEDDLVTQRMICAGREDCDSCQGDSGGPLLQFDDDGKAVVIGIVSWGIGCGQRRFPGVYTNVEVLRGWMKKNGAAFKLGKGVQVTAE